jgi:hypothetical protein
MDTDSTGQVTANFDELRRLIEADELQDRIEQSPLMSPREYGKLRGMTAQSVYYYIRTKKLAVQYCNCGRKCINVVEADAFFEDLMRKRQGQKVEPLESLEGEQ